MKQQIYNTALYLRLSRDDENFGDSVSIETQRTILREFAKENNLYVVDEYVDDGWSGTNFERPSFKRMIEDVENGRVNCIVTKDLSRFGREHVMMDYYLEFYFVEKHVRYIAVSDGEDTEKGLSDFVPFKNLFNEWYAKDTSRKVKASLAAKYRAGERICTYAPLGYKKHPSIKNKLVIDEETQWIVEKIFAYALQGNGAGRTTKMLIREKVPTPGYLNYKRDGTFANIYAGMPEEKSYAWTIRQVKSILKDETYIGNTIHYRETSISYKNKQRVRKNPSEWLRVEGTHDAIIDKADFDRVQSQIASRRRSMKSSAPQMFAGLVKCPDCGWTLALGTNSNNKTPYQYFRCSRYARMGKEYCTMHYIRYDTLYDYVLARLKHWIGQAYTDKDQLLEKLLKAGDAENMSIRRKCESELKSFEKRKSEVDRLFARLYEDYVTERITEYNFQMLSAKYQTEQVELEDKIGRAKTALREQSQNEDAARKWIALIRKYDDMTELTAPVLNALIEKIVVHTAVKHDDGTQEQEVEIYYRFVGRIE